MNQLWINRLLRWTLAAQALAYASSGLRQGSEIGSYLYLYLNIPETYAKTIDEFICLLLLSAGISLLFFLTKSSCLMLGMFCLSTSLYAFGTGGVFFSEVSLISDALKFGLPLAIAFTLKPDGNIKVPDPRNFSRFVPFLIAATFIGHGIKAMAHSPVFTDYLINCFGKYTWISLSEPAAKLMLTMIGVIDIVLGIALIFRKYLSIILYLAFWGLLTASVRFMYQPTTGGLEQMLIRLVHFSAPAWLAYYCSQFMVGKLWWSDMKLKFLFTNPYTQKEESK